MTAWHFLVWASVIVLGISCASDPNSTVDDVDASIVASRQCVSEGTSRHYRITSLRIPTADDVAMGRRVGYDVDGLEGVCGGTDYAGQVDNALIDLSDMLEAESGLDLRRSLEAAFECESGTPDCAAPRFEIELTQGHTDSGIRCWIQSVYDGSSDEPVSPPSGLYFATGLPLPAFVGSGLELAWQIPSASLEPARLTLPLVSVHFSGRIQGDQITDLVLSGYIDGADLEAELGRFYPRSTPDGSVSSFEELLAVLAQMYDVLDYQATDSPVSCRGLSIGLVGNARLVEE